MDNAALSRAMLIVDERERSARMLELARVATERATMNEEVANLYGGLAAAALHESGARAIWASGDTITAAVTAHGMITIRSDGSGGVVAFWADDPPDVEETPALPALTIVK